jgi:hypothetical protein
VISYLWELCLDFINAFGTVILLTVAIVVLWVKSNDNGKGKGLFL